jgi:integrase
MQICCRIFQFALVRGYATLNVADQFRGLLEPLHHRTRPGITDPSRLGTLLRTIEASPRRPVRYALQLLPLLFVRPSELCLAEWGEFDIEHSIWRILARRMKMGREHIAPLSRQALGLLQSLREHSGESRYLFPSTRSHTGTMALPLAETLHRLGFPSNEVTPHGSARQPQHS